VTAFEYFSGAAAIVAAMVLGYVIISLAGVAVALVLHLQDVRRLSMEAYCEWLNDMDSLRGRLMEANDAIHKADMRYAKFYDSVNQTIQNLEEGIAFQREWRHEEWCAKKAAQKANEKTFDMFMAEHERCNVWRKAALDAASRFMAYSNNQAAYYKADMRWYMSALKTAQQAEFNARKENMHLNNQLVEARVRIAELEYDKRQLSY
jgi:chromosome segregation ATPase